MSDPNAARPASELLKRVAGEYRKSSAAHPILTKDETALVQTVLDIAASAPAPARVDGEKKPTVNTFLYPH